jgi:hypothetical protein
MIELRADPALGWKPGCYVVSFAHHRHRFLAVGRSLKTLIPERLAEEGYAPGTPWCARFPDGSPEIVGHT